MPPEKNNTEKISKPSLYKQRQKIIIYYRNKEFKGKQELRLNTKMGDVFKTKDTWQGLLGQLTLANNLFLVL